MTFAALLQELRERGIDLRANGDRLHVSSPEGAMTPDLSARIREHKAELLALLSKVAENLDDTDAPIIETLQPGKPNHRPLFCMMGIHLYQDLAQAITDGTPVIGMHVPMRYIPKNRERPSLSTVAHRYVELVRAEQPHGPYMLAGLCFGGLVAYEVGRLLHEEGEKISFVALFDTILPRGCKTELYALATSTILNCVKKPDQVLKKAQTLLTAEAYHVLKRVTGSAILARKAVALPGSGDEPVDLPVDGPEADLDVATFERLRPYLDTHLVLFQALRSQSSSWIKIREDLGWQGFARSLQMCQLDGTHLGILQRPHVATLAKVIMGAIANR